jgi:hypothetical protein
MNGEPSADVARLDYLAALTALGMRIDGEPPEVERAMEQLSQRFELYVRNKHEVTVAFRRAVDDTMRDVALPEV